MLTTLILSGDSSTTPDASPTTTGPTAEEQRFLHRTSVNGI